MPVEAIVISHAMVKEKKISWNDAGDLFAFFVGDYELLNSKNSIKSLVKKGLLVRKTISPEEAVSILKNKSPSTFNTAFTTKNCEWCNSTTFILQQHHYPIKKKDNGKKIVNICPNCHSDFHHLVDYGSISIREDIIPYLKQSKLHLEEQYAKRT